MTLFFDLAQQRPEALAQHALVNRLRHDAKLQNWLRSELRRHSGTNPGEWEQAHVQVERPDEGCRWRTDVTIDNATGHPIRIEVKLAAPPTSAQREAGEEKRISVAIVRTGDEKNAAWAGPAMVLTWAAIASQIDHDEPEGAACSLLLTQADKGSTYRDRLTEKEARLDATAMFGPPNAPNRSWRATRDFLYAVDAEVKALRPPRFYDADNRMSKPRRGDPGGGYYGFSFQIAAAPAQGGPPGRRPRWIGLAADSSANPTLELWAESGSSWKKVEAIPAPGGEWIARDVAERMIASASDASHSA